jgi:hypothetical protein
MNDIDPTYYVLADGRMRRYTFPGCYPIYYLTPKGETLCPDCAAEERTKGYQIHPLFADVNWEDPALYCDECSERIESAYAEDEQP